jgi:phage antirepressor YoqD-like protein
MATKVLYTASETAAVLGVGQVRLWRAIRSKKIQPDYQSNHADLFRSETVEAIKSQRHKLFPPTK